MHKVTIEALIAQGVPMHDITRAMQQQRTQQRVTEREVREVTRQRVGVLLEG